MPVGPPMHLRCCNACCVGCCCLAGDTVQYPESSAITTAAVAAAAAAGPKRSKTAPGVHRSIEAPGTCHMSGAMLDNNWDFDKVNDKPVRVLLQVMAAAAAAAAHQYGALCRVPVH